MKKYEIFLFNGNHINHSSIAGIKKAIKHKKLTDGVYTGIKRNGTHDTWKIVSKPYVLKGKRNSSKGTTGKGITVLNPKAQLV